VTFFSRSKQRLWTKGETSNNFLLVKEIIVDCDNDTLLIKASPTGPFAIPAPILVLMKTTRHFHWRNWKDNC
jgi:hypothetical protein